MSEMVSTLRHVCRLAAKAIEKDREYHSQPDAPSIAARIEALLLYLTVIGRAARSALPAEEQAALPPEEHSELARQLAEELLEAADEHQRKTRVVH
jgi:hypothetical protein